MLHGAISSCTSHAALPLQAMAGDGAHLFVSADDGTIPLRPGETVQSVLAQRRDLELHSYYHEIEPHTMRSEFVPVSVQAAEAWRVANRGGELTEEQAGHLDRLKQEVDDHVAGTFRGKPVFMRLSTRSPKDAMDKLPRLRAQLVGMLRDRLNASDGDNAKLSTLQDCLTELAAVRSAAEFIELVSHSSRCVSDLVRLLDYQDDLPSWDLHIIIREFVPIPGSAEFRCFVHAGRMTAISQYFASTFYPEVVPVAPALRKQIAKFHTEHGSSITLDSYIMDVAVLEGKVRAVLRVILPSALTPLPPSSRPVTLSSVSSSSTPGLRRRVRACSIGLPTTRCCTERRRPRLG
mmetsp:Transcript_22511/g.52122  ORF Transcript_22511/g.52122 Transcript_22511/m.52122 type:complete len:349 (-) Transcript_22511:300-1346(-)